MNIMQCRSGGVFDFDAFNRGSWSVDDVAYALARMPRYNGHTSRIYSVAEHLLLCENAAVRRLDPSSPAFLPVRAACLIHDAHEAFIGDVSRPVKEAVGPAWYEFEESVAAHVRGVLAPALTCRPDVWDEVSKIDDYMLASERRVLMAPCSVAWPMSHSELEGVDPPRALLFPRWSDPDDVASAWLTRFDVLSGARLGV